MKKRYKKTPWAKTSYCSTWQEKSHILTRSIIIGRPGQEKIAVFDRPLTVEEARNLTAEPWGLFGKPTSTNTK